MLHNSFNMNCVLNQSCFRQLSSLYMRGPSCTGLYSSVASSSDSLISASRQAGDRQFLLLLLGWGGGWVRFDICV